MKKLTVLTSCLALTACFGGGGNGVTSGGPSGPRAATVLGAANSNTEITNMASAVIVKNDGSYVDTARTATTPDTTTFAGYTVYKLDNIDFKLIGEDGNVAFNFGIDQNGRIASATANGQTIDRDTTPEHTDRFYGKTFQLIDSTISPDEEQSVLVRTSSMTQTDLDNARDAYLTSKGRELNTANRAAISWNYLEQIWNFDSDGDDAGLTYSDFGKFTSTNVVKKRNVSIENGVVQGTLQDSDHETHMLFSGGYAIDGTTLKETLTPEHGATYTGKATGVVTTSIKTTGGDRTSYLTTYHVPYDEASVENGELDTYSTNAGLDMTKMFTTNNATLEINNDGTQKLTMPFNSQSADNNKFYDVEITMNAAGNTVTNAVFNDISDTNVTRTSMDDSPYRVNPDTALGTPALASGFYGVNSADEATGAIRYYTTKNLGNTPAPDNNPVTREWEFQGAWGLKKD